jgi:hypothetical protein
MTETDKLRIFQKSLDDAIKEPAGFSERNTVTT